MNNHCENQIIWRAPETKLSVAFNYGKMTFKVICLAGAVFANQNDFIKKKL